jgi:hypothetical protein
MRKEREKAYFDAKIKEINYPVEMNIEECVGHTHHENVYDYLFHMRKRYKNVLYIGSICL